MSVPRPPLTYDQRMIKELTGFSDKFLPVIEYIMRNEVFHSTLDWQDREEFRRGALEALGIYMRNPQPYDAELAHNRAVFQRMQAERAVSAAEQADDRATLKTTRAALYRAKCREDKAREHLGACLGTVLAPPYDRSQPQSRAESRPPSN